MANAPTRINTLLLLVITLMGATIIAMLASRAYGGPLDPPGPPASTDGVREPGTPISSLPYVITQPGRYYVTRNLSLASGAGITVSADNVLVDLGGFTLDGLGTATSGIDDGGSLVNVSVENGVLRRFQYGIFLQATQNGHISKVKVLSPGFIGIVTQYAGLLEDCEVSGSGTGVNLGQRAVMRRCHVHSTTGVGVSASAYSVVEDSVIEFADSGGVLTNGLHVTVRNNSFVKNGSGNSDVVVVAGAAVVIDNVINCVTSVYASSGQIVTTGPGGEHPNIPLYAAGFCGTP